MSTSLFTAEEKRQVRWFVMRAYKNEKMAEDRLKDKEYGLEYFIPKHYAVRTYHRACNRIFHHYCCYYVNRQFLPDTGHVSG